MRINLDKALKRWTEAGLVDEATAQAIATYERDNRRPFFARAAYLLGAFAVVLGIVALVAANWADISPSIKLSVHFAANIGISGLLLLLAAKRLTVATEVLAFVAFGLVLTLIALIGQIYQIQSPLWVGLTSWMLLASPLILVFARSGLVLASWLTALTLTLVLTSDPITDWLDSTPFFGDHVLAWLAAIYGALPLVIIAVTHGLPVSGGVGQIRRVLFAYGLLMLAVLASGSQMGWYDVSHMAHETGPLAGRLWAAIWLAGLGCSVLVLIRRSWDADRFRALAVFIAGTVAFLIVPMLFIEVELRPLAAISTIALWSLIGWAGVKAGYFWVGRLAVAIIALRLLIVYFELFGGLARTGGGLVFSGLVVIGMTYAGVQVQKRLIGRREGA